MAKDEVGIKEAAKRMETLIDSPLIQQAMERITDSCHREHSIPTGNQVSRK